MDNRKPTLDEILTAARAESPAMGREELPPLLASADSMVRTTPTPFTRRWIIMIGGLMVTAIAAMFLVIGSVENVPQVVPAPRTTNKQKPGGKEPTPATMPRSDRAVARIAVSRPQHLFRRSSSSREEGRGALPQTTDGYAVSAIAMTDQELDALGVKIIPNVGALFSLVTIGGPSDSALAYIVRPDLSDTTMAVSARFVSSYKSFDRLPRMVTSPEGKRMFTRMDRREPRQLLNAEQLKQFNQDRPLTPDELAHLQHTLDSLNQVNGFHNQYDFNRLIPVRIPVDTRGNGGNYVIFWYDPRPEILAAFPPSVLRSIRRELESHAQDNASGDSTSDARWIGELRSTLSLLLPDSINQQGNATRQETGRTHLMGLWNLQSGAIATSYASMDDQKRLLDVRYYVTSPRSVEITLYNLQGKVVRELQPSQMVGTGSISAAIDASTIPAGVYLVGISTDRSERVLHRVVIDHPSTTTELPANLPIRISNEINGSRMLELSDTTLKALGVGRYPDGRIVLSMAPFGRLQDSIMVMRFPIGIADNTVMRRTDAPTYVSRFLMPRMVTTPRGERALETRHQEDRDIDPKFLEPFQHGGDLTPDELKEAIMRVDSARKAAHVDNRLFDVNRLIPVRVNRIGNYDKDSSYFVFWFEPIPAFLGVLPDSLLLQLRSEARMVSLRKDSMEATIIENARTLARTLDSLISARTVGNNDDPKEAKPGLTIMEIARTASGALAIGGVTPNPNNGDFSVRFSLTEPRSFTISLHDIHGNQLQQLVPNTNRGPGSYEEQIRLGTIPPGLYLLTITTNRSERVVQRVMIDR